MIVNIEFGKHIPCKIPKTYDLIKMLNFDNTYLIISTTISQPPMYNLPNDDVY